MHHQNQKNQAFWWERNQERFGRNQETPQLIYTQVICDSRTWDTEDSQRFPSFVKFWQEYARTRQKITEVKKIKRRKRGWNWKAAASYYKYCWLIKFRRLLRVCAASVYIDMDLIGDSLSLSLAICTFLVRLLDGFDCYTHFLCMSMTWI